MADLADITGERMEVQEAVDLAEIRRKAQQMEKGVCGDCERCGEFSWRLVGGACAPCRDKFKLP